MHENGRAIKNVVILGSTGSIGRQAIEVVLANPGEFKIIGLAAHSSHEALLEQAILIEPNYVCLIDEEALKQFRVGYRGGAELLVGDEGLTRLCALDEADIVLNAVVGSAGLRATLAAIKAGKRLALANKESMVAAGALVNAALKESRAELLPVDSEHNALYQCLVGESASEVSRLILTASGGPFWDAQDWSPADVTVDAALAHPRWRMGPRISIDSATMMNKGFEVIEAHFLFGLPMSRIEVIVHPQSIVHSMVEFVDGSIKAHLGPTDMRLPILYALSWPRRLGGGWDALDLAAIGKLEFFEADSKKFPCLKLAFEAAEGGLSYPTVLNAADEVAVERFLRKEIGFDKISDIIAAVLEMHEPIAVDSVAAFEHVDDWAKTTAYGLLKT